MKKIYNVLYFINILFGILLEINYLFIYKYNISSIFIFIFLLIIYLISSIRFIRKEKIIEKKDICFISIYYLFLIVMFVLSVILQAITYELYNLLYFEFIMLIPHFMYILYND